MQLRINVPPLTRILLALLVGFSLLYQYLRWNYPHAHDPFAVTFAIYPWTFFTATFAEQNIITLLVAGATILCGGKYLERAWGSKEFGKFVLVVTLIPTVTSAIVYLLWVPIVGHQSEDWPVIQGSVSLQAGFLVAFKQLVPEHTVTILKGIVKIRVKHFVSIFLVANTLSGLFFGTDTALVLAWLGFLTSWTYLRFYKRQPDLSGTSTGGSTIRGDASETFAFAYFWPDLVHPPVAAMSNAIFNALVALRVCTHFSAEEVESSNGQATSRGEGALPSLLNQGPRRGGGGKREEAERRRALALKALDQRLHAATANKQQSVTVPPPPSTGSVTLQEASSSGGEATTEGSKV